MRSQDANFFCFYTLPFGIFKKGLDYIITQQIGYLALRNKEFHLNPTPSRDSRLTFLNKLRLGTGLPCDKIV